MFQMMNEARIAVGVGAAALACRGYHHSLAYARERAQGRPAVGRRRNAEVPQVPIIMHPDVRRMLLTQKVYAEGSLALVLYCARLVDEMANAATDGAGQEAEALLGLLTPVAKSWPAEFGLAANDLAIQIHGGYGYTRDFDVEQVYRDNRLNTIHEGTHGIQAIDLVGRKILRDNGAALVLLGERITSTIVRARRGNDLANDAAALHRAWADLRQEPPDKALHNASIFLSAFGHVVVGWLWLDQALAAAGASGSMRDVRFRSRRYFISTELPKARQQLAFVKSLNDEAVQFADALF